MLDIMIDLETWGTEPGSAIASIGACVVDFPDRRFYQTVTLESCLERGLKVSGSTVDFWMRQSDAARAALLVERVGITAALWGLTSWMYDAKLEYHDNDLAIWGNGANFDPPLLEAAFRACEMDIPWKFYQVRCYRTMKALVEFKALKPEIPHHALYDALTQAAHLVEIRRVLHPVALVPNNPPVKEPT